MDEQQNKKRDWIERAHWFAVAVLKVVNRLPDTNAGRAMGWQMAKSGPSVVHNLEEALGAATLPDTYNKTVTSRKEVRECRRSLLIVRDAGLLPAKEVEWHIQEATEILAMLIAGTKRLDARIQADKAMRRVKRRNRTE